MKMRPPAYIKPPGLLYWYYNNKFERAHTDIDLSLETAKTLKAHCC